MDVDIVTAITGSVYRLPIHMLQESPPLISYIVSDALIHTMPNVQQVLHQFISVLHGESRRNQEFK